MLQAGPPKMRFHELRHSCATFLVENNIPPRTVMTVRGHLSLNVTMEIHSRMAGHR
jgi:integrase